MTLALVLIRCSSKAEYGVFAMVTGFIMLLRGGQSALVLTPLATAGGRMRGAERASFVSTLAQLQAASGAALALALSAGIWCFMGDGALLLAAGSGLALAGAWLREYRRSVALLDGRSSAALAGDSVYAALAVFIVLAAWALSDQLTAGAILAAIGVAGVVAALLAFPTSSPDLGARPRDHRQVTRIALEQGRWSLPGVLVSWGQSSGYAYAVGIVLGTAVVGEIAATRLFLVPLLLTGVAWNRMFLPRAAALLADGGGAALVKRCVRTARISLVCAAVYFLALLLAWALGLGQVLPPDYAGHGGLVLAWGVYTVVNLSRSIASTALVARMEFRALFAMNVVSALATLLLVVALIGPLSAVGAIAGITAGELILALLCWRALLTTRDP